MLFISLSSFFVLTAVTLPQISKNVDSAVRYRIVQDLNAEVGSGIQVGSSAVDYNSPKCTP
jgi:hypothetical protein